jgi:tetratricopeptide (TPR) repeat protein
VSLLAAADADPYRKAVALDPNYASSLTGIKNTPSEQAQSHAARGDWNAAASYGKVFEVQPPEDGRRWFEYAAVLLLSGDQPGYRKICAEMVELSGQPGMRSYLVARACTLAADSVEDSDQPGKCAEKELMGSRAVWSLAEQGALAYRAGRYDEAATLLDQSLQADSKHGRAVLCWLWLSLVEQRRGKPAEARVWLGKAAKWFAQCPEGVPVLPDNDKGLHLYNWLEAQILRREAEALLTSKK